jgi:hypothetical protein
MAHEPKLSFVAEKCNDSTGSIKILKLQVHKNTILNPTGLVVGNLSSSNNYYLLTSKTERVCLANIF